MRFLATVAIYLSTLAISANASVLTVNNFCRKSLWITDANQTDWTPPTQELFSAVSYLTLVKGEGNQLGVSVISDYYNDKTPRFILGTSVKDGTLWWTVNQIGGDPFDGEPFNVTSTDNACGNTTEYNLEVHNCPDGDFTLQFNPCVDNS